MMLYDGKLMPLYVVEETGAFAFVSTTNLLHPTARGNTYRSILSFQYHKTERYKQFEHHEIEELSEISSSSMLFVITFRISSLVSDFMFLPKN
jgi:hypothetical protein